MTNEQFNALRYLHGTYWTKANNWGEMACGTELALTQEAYIAGTNEEPFYTAHAVDRLGNEYTLVWPVFENWESIEENEDMCDWEKYSVEAL